MGQRAAEILLTIVGTLLLLLGASAATFGIIGIAFGLVQPAQGPGQRVAMLPLVALVLGPACIIASLTIRRVVKRLSAARRQAPRGFDVVRPPQ